MYTRTAKWIVFALVALLQGGCDDADVKVCFGNASFCETFFTRNTAPTADAGSDQEVSGGALVVLDGSNSSDPDGSITSFSWVQTEGPPVTLREANNAVADFDAPAVLADTTLIFELTVVDNQQAAAQDAVSVRVRPRTSAALETGVAMLSRSLTPWPVQPPAPCIEAIQPTGAGWFAYAGVWLAVMGRSFGDDADPLEVTRYLDAARLLLAQAGESEVTDDIAAPLWQQGLETLHQFALERDPGLADWARNGQASSAGEQLLADLFAGRSRLRLEQPNLPAVVPAEPTTVSTEVKMLMNLRCHGRLDPLQVASALMMQQH